MTLLQNRYSEKLPQENVNTSKQYAKGFLLRCCFAGSFSCLMFFFCFFFSFRTVKWLFIWQIIIFEADGCDPRASQWIRNVLYLYSYLGHLVIILNFFIFYGSICSMPSNLVRVR